MAQLKDTLVTGDLRVTGNYTGAVYYVAGTAGSNAGDWIVNLSEVPTPYTGLKILYKTPDGGNSSSTARTLTNDDTTTVSATYTWFKFNGKWYKGYFNYSSNLTTHYPSGRLVMFIFDATLNSNAGGFTNDYSYYSTTASKVTVTAQNPSSETMYYPYWSTAASGSLTTYSNDGVRILTKEGTTSANGYGCLVLGNGTSSGTAGNKYGALRIYATNSYYLNIDPPAITANRTVSWPTFTASGYILGKSSTAAVGASNQLVYFTAAGIATAGAKITSGTSDPSGGSSGDIYIQYSA